MPNIKLILLHFLISCALIFMPRQIQLKNDFRKELNELKKERGEFLNEISLRVNASRFFSGKCLENLDIDYETGMRSIELRRQAILLKRREFRAYIREKKRLRKKEQRNKTSPQ